MHKLVLSTCIFKQLKFAVTHIAPFVSNPVWNLYIKIVSIVDIEKNVFRFLNIVTCVLANLSWVHLITGKNK